MTIHYTGNAEAFTPCDVLVLHLLCGVGLDIGSTVAEDVTCEECTAWLTADQRIRRIAAARERHQRKLMALGEAYMRQSPAEAINPVLADALDAAWSSKAALRALDADAAEEVTA